MLFVTFNMWTDTLSRWWPLAALEMQRNTLVKEQCNGIVCHPWWSSGCMLNSGFRVTGSIPTRGGGGFLRALKILKHAFLWRESKAVSPMSCIYGMLENPTSAETLHRQNWAATFLVQSLALLLGVSASLIAWGLWWVDWEQLKICRRWLLGHFATSWSLVQGILPHDLGTSWWGGLGLATGCCAIDYY
jgi:hypothetical protein